LDRVKQANKVVNQLGSTGAKFEVLSVDNGKAVVRQFIDTFIETEKRERCQLNLSRPIIGQKPVDYHKYFLPRYLKDVNEVVRKERLLHWLGGARQSHCYLFFSEPWIAPMIVDISSLRDADLSLFSDSYLLNFETRRLIVLTRDGEAVLCEMPKAKR
jgi:hypothetical protein